MVVDIAVAAVRGTAAAGTALEEAGMLQGVIGTAAAGLAVTAAGTVGVGAGIMATAVAGVSGPR